MRGGKWRPAGRHFDLRERRSDFEWAGSDLQDPEEAELTEARSGFRWRLPSRIR